MGNRLRCNNAQDAGQNRLNLACKILACKLVDYLGVRVFLFPALDHRGRHGGKGRRRKPYRFLIQFVFLSREEKQSIVFELHRLRRRNAGAVHFGLVPDSVSEKVAI